jgi:hypothetical protein
LVQQRKLDPIDIEIEFGFELPHKRQGQLVKTATEDSDPQSPHRGAASHQGLSAERAYWFE